MSAFTVNKFCIWILGSVTFCQSVSSDLGHLTMWVSEAVRWKSVCCLMQPKITQHSDLVLGRTLYCARRGYDSTVHRLFHLLLLAQVWRWTQLFLFVIFVVSSDENQLSKIGIESEECKRRNTMDYGAWIMQRSLDKFDALLGTFEAELELGYTGYQVNKLARSGIV